MSSLVDEETVTGEEETVTGEEVENQDNGEENGDDDEECLTPAEILFQMTQALINESAAPKLLAHKYQYVECLVDQVEHMESNIAKQTDKSQLKCTAHRMELYRINYIINQYIRVRLNKIAENTNEIIREHFQRQNSQAVVEKEELLDEREVELAESFKFIYAEHMRESFLKLIPDAIAQIPVSSTSTGKSRVFIEMEEVSVPDMTDPNAEVIVHLEKGSRHLIPFQSIEEHLEQGNVNLL